MADESEKTDGPQTKPGKREPPAGMDSAALRRWEMKQARLEASADHTQANPTERRTKIWPYIVRLMQMDATEVRKMKAVGMSMGEAIALRFVQALDSGKSKALNQFKHIPYLVNRDEGKPIERIQIEEGRKLSDEQCEQIRQSLRKVIESRVVLANPEKELEHDGQSASLPALPLPAAQRAEEAS